MKAFWAYKKEYPHCKEHAVKTKGHSIFQVDQLGGSRGGAGHGARGTAAPLPPSGFAHAGIEEGKIVLLVPPKKLILQGETKAYASVRKVALPQFWIWSTVPLELCRDLLHEKNHETVLIHEIMLPMVVSYFSTVRDSDAIYTT